MARKWLLTHSSSKGIQYYHYFGTSDDGVGWAERKLGLNPEFWVRENDIRYTYRSDDGKLYSLSNREVSENATI